jgi:hypothetical protein
MVVEHHYFRSPILPPAPDKTGPVKPVKDYTPLKILVRFIENNGDPSAYLETMSISYPDHAFCQTLITCESAEQLLEKLKSLEPKLPALFADTGKAWLEEFSNSQAKAISIKKIKYF